jgi:hypothetical protein
MKFCEEILILRQGSATAVSYFQKPMVCASIAAAVVCGYVFASVPVGAQDAPEQPADKPPAEKKVFKRPTEFRKIAPDVLTTITVHRDPEECYTTMPTPDLSLLVKGDPKLQAVPKVEPLTATLGSKVRSATFRRAIWNLEFTFKPLRMIRVDLPQASGKLRNKLIWYMVYKVRNPGQHFVPVRNQDGSYKLERPDEIDPDNPGVRFVPFFVLVENREFNRYFRDHVIPSALPQILRREFRAGEFKVPKVLNTAQMAQTPIRAGEEVWGVVTWENVDPRIDFLSIYIQGLSNAYHWKETRDSYDHGDIPGVGREKTRKTLRLNFWRPGDEYLETEKEIIYGIPGELDHEWMFR